VIVPTPDILELETQSNHRVPLLLPTITPLLAMGPDDISKVDDMAYIPAPTTDTGKLLLLLLPGEPFSLTVHVYTPA
jgi:hypothetical protein